MITEIPQDTSVENKEQSQQNNTEVSKSVDETKSELTQEIEKSSADFENENENVSAIESSVELDNPQEVDAIKNELKIDENIEQLDTQARILKQETEKQIEWVQQDNHQWDENNYFRVVNENGYADYLENDVVRSNPEGDTYSGGNEMLSGRKTPFPSFAKGQPNLEHYSQIGESNYILESETHMYTKGDINPVTGNEIRSKHGAAYRPIDSETGNAMSELSSKHIKDVYQKNIQGNILKQKTKEEQN